MKLCNAYNLVFLIDSTYKTNRYMLLLLDFVGVTPTGITFSTGFTYLDGECLNNDVTSWKFLPGIFVNGAFWMVIYIYIYIYMSIIQCMYICIYSW